MRSFLLPASVVLIALFAAPFSERIPPSFSGLWAYGPYLALTALALLATAWRRGRALLAAVLYFAGVLVFDDLVPGNLRPPHFAELVAFIVVPVNVMILSWYHERGIFNLFGGTRLAFIVAQCAGAWAAAFYAPAAVEQFRTFGADLIEAPAPLAYLVIAGFSVVVTAAIALLQDSKLATSLCVATLGYLAAVLLPERSGVLFASAIAAGVVVIIAMLQDSWRLAYRDDLTGLPSRRALNEMFLTLGGQYSVAMMDVDHFKKFNDTHGHDVGDDVLKMVATQIARVGGGGRAFRYGGEEFTVVFASRSKAEALIALEGVRAGIEDYEMVVREKRQKDEGGSEAKTRRGQGAKEGQKTVSVTISIGVAEHERGEPPEDTLKRADEALYDAKKSGRNRVMAYGDKGKKKKKAA